MAVQDLVEGVSSREAVVEELKELPTDVGLDTLAERWIEPQDVAAAPPPPCRWAAGWAEDELMVVASPLEGVLERSLGRLEHGLAGGEGGEAPLDLQGDVLEDMTPCAENAKINVKVIGASQEMCSYLPLLQKLPAALVIRKVKVTKHSLRVSLREIFT